MGQKGRANAVAGVQGATKIHVRCGLPRRFSMQSGGGGVCQRMLQKSLRSIKGIKVTKIAPSNERVFAAECHVTRRGDQRSVATSRVKSRHDRAAASRRRSLRLANGCTPRKAPANSGTRTAQSPSSNFRMRMAPCASTISGKQADRPLRSSRAL